MLRYFNFEHAILAFATMGVSTFAVNLFGGSLREAGGAGLVQGALSFGIVGLNTAFFEALQKRFHNVLAVLLPALFNSLLSLVLHHFNQSPQPYATACFVFLTAFLNFSALCYCREAHATISLRYLVTHYLGRGCSDDPGE